MYYQNIPLVELTLHDTSNSGKQLTFAILEQICKPNRQNIIKINIKRWEQLDMKNLTKNMENWGVQNLDLEANQDSQILYSIAQIYFTKMKCLNIKLNRIQSLEPLICLNAPFLQVLHLDSNEFATVRSLTKCKFPKMKQLHFTGNKIIDAQCIYQCNWPLLSQLHLEWFYGNQILTDLSSLAKLPSNNLFSLSIQRPQRIIKIQVLAALKRKFIKLRFIAFKVDINGLVKSFKVQRSIKC